MRRRTTPVSAVLTCPSLVQTVVIESVVMAPFAAAAVAGFKSSAGIVVAALAAHGVFHGVHGHVIRNAGVPAWWPAWCLAYDVGAGRPRLAPATQARRRPTSGDDPRRHAGTGTRDVSPQWMARGFVSVTVQR
jgi:hypothetical protein